MLTPIDKDACRAAYRSVPSVRMGRGATYAAFEEGWRHALIAKSVPVGVREYDGPTQKQIAAGADALKDIDPSLSLIERRETAEAVLAAAVREVPSDPAKTIVIDENSTLKNTHLGNRPSPSAGEGDVSSCCHCRMLVDSSGDGTSFYRCYECGQATSPLPVREPTPNDLQGTPNLGSSGVDGQED